MHIHMQLFVWRMRVFEQISRWACVLCHAMKPVYKTLTLLWCETTLSEWNRITIYAHRAIHIQVHTIHISCFSYIFQSIQFIPHILYHFYISYHYNSHLVFHAIHTILIIPCNSCHISYIYFISTLQVISFTSFRILFLSGHSGEYYPVLLFRSIISFMSKFNNLVHSPIQVQVQSIYIYTYIFIHGSHILSLVQLSKSIQSCYSNHIS